MTTKAYECYDLSDCPKNKNILKVSMNAVWIWGYFLYSYTFIIFHSSYGNS